MRTEPRPTRAEVSDAANAVDDGVDAIMLTGETAAGKFPVRAVQTLDLVIRDAELIPSRLVPLGKLDMLLRSGVALCEAAVTLGQHSQAAAIVAVTRSGRTARVLAALRPRVPIYAVTERPEVARWLTLAWGVRSVVGRLQGDLDGTVRRAADELAARGDIAPESMIVVVSVSQEQGRGPSNFVKLQRV
jgi:pyruvate kinase